MSPATASHPRRQPPAVTILALTAAAIVGSLVPALVGLAFLLSLGTRLPLIAVAADRWPWLSGGRTGAKSARDRPAA